MRFRYLFILSLPILLPSLVFAQRGIGVESRTTDIAQRWAIIIGINQYDPSIGDLKYAVDDAKAFYQTITTIPDGFPSRNVVLMTDDAPNPNNRPTRNNIFAMLPTWLGLAGPDDTTLIYVAAHGMEQDGKSYILPHDARLSQLEHTSIELAHFKDVLHQSKARNKVLIVDACHSGAGRAPRTMGTAMEKELSKASEGMVMLASCDIQERSHEMDERGHGAYTYFLIEALQGAADRDSDRLLSAYEINLYAYEQTRRWAARRNLRQTPKYVSAVSGQIILGGVTDISNQTIDHPSALQRISTQAIPTVPSFESGFLRVTVSGITNENNRVKLALRITNTTDKDIYIAVEQNTAILTDKHGQTLRVDRIDGIRYLLDTNLLFGNKYRKNYNVLHPGIIHTIGMVFSGKTDSDSFDFSMSCFKHDGSENKEEASRFSVGITEITLQEF